MRRAVVLLAVLAIVAGLAGFQPAAATHNCTNPSCNPVTIAVLEGVGNICSRAGTDCTYHNDVFWPSPKPTTGIAQGYYWPGVGPAGNGPFSFNAGPQTDVPNSACVSTIAGPGCTFVSGGTLGPGVPVNGVTTVGGYCGSSKGVGVSTFNSGTNPVTGANVTTTASFGWSQSAATILPLTGRVTASSPSGGVGATVVGFTSSRGIREFGNCGITQATTAFQVEGMIVTF